MKVRDQGTEDSSTLMPYDGRPFQMLKNTYFKCAQGGKIEAKRQNPSSGHHSLKKKRLKPTKKINCQAKMTVKCLRVFTEDCYKTKSLTYRNGSHENRRIVQKLKEALRQTSPPTSVLRYHILMSSEDEHNHTADTSKVVGIIHPRLSQEIYNFVANNVCSTKTLKIHLEEVVKHMFKDEDRPKPDKLNRCYYPNAQTIRNHLHKALRKIKENKYDQGRLEACIQSWKTEYPDDRFKFRACEVGSNSEANEDGTSSTLLFCHQTEWQQDLLTQYGNGIALLDAAYKTNRYDIPLYFLVVLTDSGYCIVGTIVIQWESRSLLAEALAQFKTWNPAWQPKYFLTHYSDYEITALQQSFPDTTIYLCAFQMEQTWHRWLTDTRNVSKEAVAPIKKLWRDIATSSTFEDCLNNIAKMSIDPVYQACPNAQEYFTKEWHSVSHMWIPAYQASDYVAKSNAFDVESQNKILSHTYLKNTKDSTLTGFIRTIINSFLPHTLQTYCDLEGIPYSVSKPSGPGHDDSYMDHSTLINDSFNDGVLIFRVVDEKPEATDHKLPPTKDKGSADMKKGCLELQENFKFITSYSHTDLPPENLRTLVEMSRQMVDTVRSFQNK